MRLLTVIFLLLLGCILTNSQLGLSYAAMGLNLWFEKMIPSLLPFMMLSGIMVRRRAGIILSNHSFSPMAA